VGPAPGLGDDEEPVSVSEAGHRDQAPLAGAATEGLHHQRPVRRVGRERQAEPQGRDRSVVEAPPRRPLHAPLDLGAQVVELRAIHAWRLTHARRLEPRPGTPGPARRPSAPGTPPPQPTRRRPRGAGYGRRYRRWTASAPRPR